MINVQALQSTLSAMSLPQIQQYAALHKNDPYVVSMALSIANTKKEAMTAQQGMAGQRPMPKVVDQDIAAIAPRQPMAQAAPAALMLPEEQGIGQLPAPNIQGMCGGGIVAFEEGGEVPRFQGKGPSQVPSSTTGYAIPGMTQSDLYAQAKAKYDAGQPLTSTEKALLFSAAPLAAAGDVLMSPINAVRNLVRNPLDTSPAPSMTPFSDARANALYGDTSLQPTSASLGRSPSNAEIEQMIGLAALPATPGVKTESNVPVDGATPTADQSTRAAPTSNAPGGYSVPSTTSVLSGIEKLLGPREKVPEQADIESQLEERQKPFFEKLDKKVSEQRNKLSSDREDAIYMAMMRGGFAAAAGKSPFALSNIAEGGKEGVADLADSIKDLRKAAQEQSRMEMELEKSRMEASTGNLKTAWDRQDKARQLGAERDKLLASAYTSISDATIRAGATVEAAKIGSTGELRGLEALGAAPEGSALRKGFELKQELLKRTSLSETWAKLAYPSGNMGQPNEAFLARFPTPETYVREALQQDRASQGGAGGGAPMIRSR